MTRWMRAATCYSVKALTLDANDLTLDGLLREAADGEVVFLTSHGEAKFALVAVDEGDLEVLALRSNMDFLAYLDACKSRARTQPRMTLAEIREHFGDDAGERTAD